MKPRLYKSSIRTDDLSHLISLLPPSPRKSDAFSPRSRLGATCPEVAQPFTRTKPNQITFHESSTVASCVDDETDSLELLFFLSDCCCLLISSQPKKRNGGRANRFSPFSFFPMSI